MTTARELQEARDDPAHKHDWHGWVETSAYVHERTGVKEVPSGTEYSRCWTCGKMRHRRTGRPETTTEGGYT